MASLAGAYGWLGSRASSLGIGAAFRGAMFPARGLAGVARGMNWMAAANPYTRAAITGAAAGGLYGAFSDDTSVLGGAMMGAGVGYGGLLGYKAANIGLSHAVLGHGWRRSVQAMGRYSASTLGRTWSRAYNPIAGHVRSYFPRFAPGLG